jgi:hypothetical protein
VKVRKTCRQCGYVSEQGLAGSIGKAYLKSFTAVLFTSLWKNQSYRDSSNLYAELGKCPNCGSTNWSRQFIKGEKGTSKKTSQSRTQASDTPQSTADKPWTTNETIGCGCLVVILIVIISAIIGQCGKKEIREEITAEQVAKDSLQSEESYAQAKQLFDEGKYREASPVLKKVGSKHKEYGEAQNMIVFVDEYIKVATAMSALDEYIASKETGTASKEFQSVLKTAPQIQVSNRLLMVVLDFGVAAENIQLCEKFQKSEMKYLKPQERNNLKAELKTLITSARNKLKKEQRRDFPILRKEMAKIIQEIIIENNKMSQIKIRATGNGNTNLEFLNVMFINDDNIEYFQKQVLVESNAIENFIKPFRYKKISYKWIESKAGNYYEYNPPADDADVTEDTLPNKAKK